MTAWRDTLGRIGVRAMPGAGGFWRWWQQSLLAWLPQRWQWQLGLSQARLLLQLDGDTLQLLRQRDQSREAIASLPWPVQPQEVNGVLPTALDGLPRHWLLPSAHALRRPLRLPAAAAARLQDVARFEIDRQTPFTADQVYFDARVLDVREDGQLDAELVVVPRRMIDGPAGVPDAWANALSGIDVADAQGAPLGVNLLPPARRLRRSDPMQRWNLLLTATAVVLLAVAGWLLLDNRRQAADDLRAQVQANAARARQVAAERQQLMDLVEGATFFQKQRATRPTSVEIWDELSRRLPGGTYLEKFSVEGGQLQLIGLSNEASSLVRRLEGSPLWRTPSLTGVLQSDAGRNVDRFTITAELAGPDAKEAADATQR
ncbi:PilN domain-containing protein [Xanthomonas sp. WHRI 10064A]|uniref:PilN domain-containing protein n=1 Tax=unclassified Xanthomonas TaxID=2643310 RepID=UPI002B23E93D|nr:MULTISPECIES: PilN domain-containing protein [unclassified Xanthomonas]MEA9588845.1 PilN domain-containing protein [Xanthomonas sp. WHRI 10064B]MEA9613830.1 PilN domain-containing protein [Xanthomonas sp. WHRI 10064A]